MSFPALARKANFSCRQVAQQIAARRTQEEEAAALRVAETIKAKVEEVMASEATQQRIQRRLKEERASLEDKVIIQVYFASHFYR